MKLNANFKLDTFVEAISKSLKEGYFLSEFPSSQSSPSGREGKIYGIGLTIIYSSYISL
jgi:hypothetical protein